MLVEDLRKLLGSIDRSPACGTRFSAPVAALAVFAAVLAEPVGDLVLPAKHAYHHVADWMNTTLTEGNPLER